MSDRKLIYIFLCFGCITISFNVAAIAAAIPAISADLNIPDLLASKIIPFYMIPYGIGALLYAPLTRRFSYRVLLSVPLCIYAFSSYYCASITGIERFFIGRVGMGVAGASAIPLGLLIIGQLFDKNIRGRLVGVFFGCSFIASIAGIVLSGTVSWRWLFYVPALIGAVTALSFLIIPSKALNKIHGVKINYISVFKNVSIRNLFVFIFMISFLYHGVHKWFGVYLSRIYELDKFTISLFFIVILIGGALGQLIGGFITDKKGRLAACIVGILILSFSTMLLFFDHSMYVLAFILSMITFGWTIGHNGVSTVLTDFPEEHRPELASLNSSVRFIAGGIGFQISSLFVEKSFSMTFFIFGFFMFALSFILKKVIPE